MRNGCIPSSRAIPSAASSARAIPSTAAQAPFRRSGARSGSEIVWSGWSEPSAARDGTSGPSASWPCTPERWSTTCSGRTAPPRASASARGRMASSRTARMTTPAWASQAGGGGASAAPTVSSSGSGIACLRRPYNRTTYPTRASASPSPTPARPGPMIPTAESVVIAGPLTLVPLVRGNLCGREGEQILRRPRAAHQGERRLHLVVFRQTAAHLGRATEHVARRFIAELVGDQGACPGGDAVGNARAAGAEAAQHLRHHFVPHGERGVTHAARSLELERVRGQHIPEHRNLVAQRLHVIPLRGREGVRADEQIGPDSAAAHHCAAAIGVKHGRGIDLRGIVALLRRDNLRLLIGFVLALSLDRATTRRVPARRRELERRLRRELPERLHQPLPER